jgi:hypothetical protein
VELELLVQSQAQKITELEAAYVDLKCEKENVMARYQRLAEKHKCSLRKQNGRGQSLPKPT